jgi:hypothetical protein
MIVYFNKVQALLGTTKYIKWRKESLIPLSTKAVSVNKRQSLTELRLICATVGDADCPATWSHPDSSEQVAKGLNSCVRISSHCRYKPENPRTRSHLNVLWCLFTN